LTRHFPVRATLCGLETAKGIRQGSSSFVKFRRSAVGQASFHSRSTSQMKEPAPLRAENYKKV